MPKELIFPPINDEMIHVVAAALDHPSVYMGGPSHNSRRRALRVIEALAAYIEEKNAEKDPAEG